MPFTLRNVKDDLEDFGSNFDGAPDLEFRLASKALELEQCGLSYQRIPPDYRFPYGHISIGTATVHRILIQRGINRPPSTPERRTSNRLQRRDGAAKGLSKRDVMRCLERIVVREVHNTT